MLSGMSATLSSSDFQPHIFKTGDYQHFLCQDSDWRLPTRCLRNQKLEQNLEASRVADSRLKEPAAVLTMLLQLSRVWLRSKRNATFHHLCIGAAGESEGENER